MSTNLKLFKPAKQGQDANSGGPMTRTEFTSGAIGDMFTTVTDLDAARGEVQLEEFFLAADTIGNELLEDAHVIVRKAPIDPKVTVVLFRVPAAEWTYRAEAAEHVEGYSIPAIQLDWRVWGDHPVGVQSLRLWGTPISRLPSVGDVIFVVDARDGGTFEQAFKIQDLQVQAFEAGDLYSYGFQDLFLELNRPLEQEITGSVNPAQYLTDDDYIVVSAQVAPNAKYYGITGLTADVAQNDTAINVDTVYGQVIPAGQSTSSILDAPALPLRNRVFDYGQVSRAKKYDLGYNNLEQELTYSLPFGVKPGTAVVVAGFQRYGLSEIFMTVQDDGEGGFTYVEEPPSNPEYYDFTFEYNPFRVTAKWLDGVYLARSIELSSFEPQLIMLSEPAHSGAQAIDAGNRGTVYVVSLNPLPSPGSFTFEWRTLDRWYSATDNGDGTLGGDGTGTINYDTGTAQVTLPFSPDLDTKTVWSWASNDQLQDLEPVSSVHGTEPDMPRFTFETGTPIEPGSFNVIVDIGGINSAGTDDGNGNIVTTEYYGFVNYGSGEVTIAPRNYLLNSAGPDITWTANQEAGAVNEDVSSPTVSGGQVQFTIATALPIAPGSVKVRVPLDHRFPDGFEAPGWGNPNDYTYVDDGAGNLRRSDGNFDGANNPPQGTVNYATGEYSLDEVVQNHTTALRWTGTGWVAQQVSSHYAADGNPIHVWHSSTTGGSADSGSVPMSGLELKFRTCKTDPFDLVRESISITIGDSDANRTIGGILTCAANGTLTLYDSFNPTIPLSEGAGSVSSKTGIATIPLAKLDPIYIGRNTGWRNNWITNGVVDRGQGWDATEVKFRTVGAPLQPASLTMLARRASDDALVQAVTNANGDISGDATGETDQESGVAEVTWNDPITPSSLTHSGVIVLLAPQDAELIGLDGTRLPSDGLVPIFIPGYQVVLHDEADEALPGGLVADDTHALSTTGLSFVGLTDAALTAVPDDGTVYTVDLRTGVITIVDPTGYTQPFTARKLWDDTLPVSGVQATGVVDLASPVPRAYAAASAKLSSLMEVGNLFARQNVFFDQETWDQVTWEDTVQGNPAPASFDAVNYPPQFVNDGAISERWAFRVTVADTTVEVFGETLGLIGSFPMGSDIAPLNPENAKPYFTLPAGGWGTGWDPGNVLRMNTIAAGEHGWALRCVNLGAADLEEDGVTLQPRVADVIA